MRTLLLLSIAISGSASAPSALDEVDHQAAFCRGALHAALATKVNTDNPMLLDAVKTANAKLESADAKLAAYLTRRIVSLDQSILLAAEQEGQRAQIESGDAVAKCLAEHRDRQSQATMACMELAAQKTNPCVSPDFLPVKN